MAFLERLFYHNSLLPFQKTSSHTDHRHGKTTKWNTDELNSVWTQIKITLTARTPPRAPPLRPFWAHLPEVQRNQEPVLFPSSGGTSETVCSSWWGSRGPPLYFHLAGLAFFFHQVAWKGSFFFSLFLFYDAATAHLTGEKREQDFMSVGAIGV